MGVNAHIYPNSETGLTLLWGSIGPFENFYLSEKENGPLDGKLWDRKCVRRSGPGSNLSTKHLDVYLTLHLNDQRWRVHNEEWFRLFCRFPFERRDTSSEDANPSGHARHREEIQSLRQLRQVRISPKNVFPKLHDSLLCLGADHKTKNSVL